MDDQNQEPQGLDEFLGSDTEPGQLPKGVTSPLLSVLEDKKTNGDAIVPTTSPIDLLAGGLGQKIGSALVGSADTILGNEIGSIGRDIMQKGEGSVANDIAQSGKMLESSGIEVPTVKGKPNFGKVTVIDEPKPSYGKVKWEKMADGGNVEQPQSNEPAGLNEFLAPELNEERYGTPLEMIKTAGEGLARGILGPIAPIIERLYFNAKPEDILARQRTNPVTSGLGELGGLSASLATGFGEGALAAKVGELATPIAEGSSIASRMGSLAARGAIENAAITAGDETSNMIINDPDTTAQSALADVGLSAVIGGALGGGLGAVEPLWQSKNGTKVGQLIEDFKGRLDEHLHNPDPIQATTDELSQLYRTMDNSASEVYGPAGLKAQEIRKVVPQLNDKMVGQVNDIATKVNDTIDKMVADQHSYPPRLTKKLQGDLQAFEQKVSGDNVTSADMFEAIQDLKQTMQGYAKFEKRTAPFAEEYDFVRDSKKLAHDFRTALEDKDIWGKAAERQESINKAFSSYLPTLKDFEKKFVRELKGEKVIDKGLVETYLNQAGKSKGELKRGVLRNFIDESEKYHKVIGDIHTNLGLEQPLEFGSLHNVKNSLTEKTAGARLADIFIDKGLTEAGAKGLGAGTGAILGSAVGHPGIGALVGSHILSPFYKSVLPALVKPFITHANSAIGAKTAVDYGVAAAKGQNAIKKAAKHVFAPAREAMDYELSNPSKRDKLDKQLMDLQMHPEKLYESSGNSLLNKYMPEHNASLGNTSAQAVVYLNSLRPNKDKESPLDSDKVPSTTEKAAYNEALDIALNPLLVFTKVKNGTIKPQDLNTLHAIAPALYTNMQKHMISNMVDARSKNITIPYKTRIGASMFLGQPLDSTMKPGSILAAQILSQSKGQPIQRQTQDSGSVKHSTAKLSKVSNQYMTSDQARQTRANKVKQ